MKVCIVCSRNEGDVRIPYAGPKCRSCHEKEPHQERSERDRKRKERGEYLRSKEYRRQRSADFRASPQYAAKGHEYYIRYKYGLSLEAYQAMLEGQKHVCAVCMKPNTRKGDTRLMVDHCHVTGRVRGLLCHNCNAALGMADDDPDLLERLAEYLKERSE